MTHTAMGEIGELRAAMAGPVIARGDSGFDDGRRVWNAQIDRRPSVIAREPRQHGEWPPAGILWQALDIPVRTPVLVGKLAVAAAR